MTGHTDAVVLTLPEAALGGGHLGRLLGALVTAGAFAGRSSPPRRACSPSVAGVVFTDVLRPGRSGSVRGLPGGHGCSPRSCRSRSRSTSPTWTSPVVVGSRSRWRRPSFCPLLVLGIWWRRLTDLGAAAGILIAAARRWWPC
jgi:hypothetical protein